MDEVRGAAKKLADKLFAELEAGQHPKVGLDEIEIAALAIYSPHDRRYRELVNWTIHYLVRKV